MTDLAFISIVMKTPSRRWLLAGIATLTVAFIVICYRANFTKLEPVSDRDEKAVAGALLAAKLSGPRYFTPRVADPAGDDGRWIWVDDAVAQIQRIADERNLGTEGIQAIRQLTVQLAEPHPYRAIGGQRINLLRLNLSLDRL